MAVALAHPLKRWSSSAIDGKICQLPAVNSSPSNGCPLAASVATFVSGEHRTDQLDSGDTAALTSAMARSDEAAWRAFHRAYFDRLYRYLIVLQRGDEDSAAELVQLTFLRIVRHVREFDDPAVFWSWLTCLARCAAADEGRKRKRRSRLMEAFAHREEMRRAGGRGDGGQEGLAVLSGCLAELPADDRLLVEGKYFERRTCAQLAADLGTTEKAVESRLGRLRKKLRAAIEKHSDPATG